MTIKRKKLLRARSDLRDKIRRAPNWKLVGRLVEISRRKSSPEEQETAIAIQTELNLRQQQIARARKSGRLRVPKP